MLDVSHIRMYQRTRNKSFPLYIHLFVYLFNFLKCRGVEKSNDRTY